VYICFLLYFPLNYSRCGILFWGFIIGLLTDIFSNTPGVGAASTTLAAMLQPVLLRAMAPKDSTEDMMPNFQTMGYGNYVRFFIILIVIHHLLVFLLESFSYFDSLYLVMSCASSIVLTTSIVWAIEHLLNRKS
jgi:rod shape-determining protein MreD